jgi:Salmonella virulence plasmid 65kDa B protein
MYYIPEKTNLLRSTIYINIYIYCVSLFAQPTSYGTLYTETTFANKSIDLTLPDGNVAGVASTSGGSANYTVPIVVPPGTKGITPSISLAYNSNGGDGQIGMGWSLSSLSQISRIGNSPFCDFNANGTQSYTQHVQLNTNDKFTLDGQRLVLKTGAYGFQTSTYGTEVENFATIIAKGTSSASGIIPCFEVVTKEGTVMEYGNTADLRKTTSSGVYLGC